VPTRIVYAALCHASPLIGGPSCRVVVVVIVGIVACNEAFVVAIADRGGRVRFDDVSGGRRAGSPDGGAQRRSGRAQRSVSVRKR
jgi:hypothetical protein